MKKMQHETCVSKQHSNKDFSKHTTFTGATAAVSHTAVFYDDDDAAAKNLLLR